MGTTDGFGSRSETRLRRFGLAILTVALTLVLPGCQMVFEALAEESDPEHVGARAHTLRDFDAYGNEIPTTK